MVDNVYRKRGIKENIHIGHYFLLTFLHLLKTYKVFVIEEVVEVDVCTGYGVDGKVDNEVLVLNNFNNCII